MFLLQHGADVDAVNNNGDTALHLAMAFPDDIYARALLAFHSNINTKNKDGMKPVMVAKYLQNQLIADQMLAYENQALDWPEIQEIELELVQSDATRIQQMKARRIFQRPSNTINAAKISEMDDRMHSVEQNIEKIFELITKIKAVGTTPHDDVHNCASCFTPNAKECPYCHIYFCETCMNKAIRHKCAEKQ